MASLETLTLQIEGNASKATGAIGDLTKSLRSLAESVGLLNPGLRELNRLLSSLKGYGSMRLPTVGNGNTSAGRAVADRTKEFKAHASVLKEYKNLPSGTFKSWMYGPNPLPKITRTVGTTEGMLSDEELRRRNPGWFWNPDDPKQLAEKVGARNAALQARGNALPIASSIKSLEQFADSGKVSGVAAQIKNLMDTLNRPIDHSHLGEFINQTMGIGVACKDAADSALAFQEQMKPTFGERVSGAIDAMIGKVQKLTASLSKVGKMARTMLLRTAIRSLMKAFSEAWTSVYQFSKAMGGEFATSVDKAKTLLTGTAISIISAFAPAFQAMIPILEAVVSAIRYLCTAIQWLFSLLGMSGEFLGASTDAINKYAGAASGGSKANKEMLASFDELNVIASESGGGGGGGGASYLNGMFSDAVSDEMAKIQLIVSESLLGIGLILACAGHVGLGVGIMAIGAAGIAKTVIEDWGKLSSEVRDEMATIMAIVGVSTLALGAILAFSGVSVGLGLGLMAIGAANLAAVAYVSWDGGISSELRMKLFEIGSIVGTSLLAIGAILLFTGAAPGIGLGMLVAGGATLVSAIAPNWDYIASAARVALQAVEAVITPIFQNILSIASTAWDTVRRWWEDTGIGSAVREVWGAVSSFFDGLWRDISGWAVNAWNEVSTWFDTNILDRFRQYGVWGGIKSLFEDIWNSIAGWANSAWNTVSEWWQTNVTENMKKNGVWGGVVGFFNGIWNSIKDLSLEVYNAVHEWWVNSGLPEMIKSAWDSISGFFEGLWNSVKKVAEDAWNLIRNLWEASGIPQAICGAWDVLKGFFSGLWDNIKTWADGAWKTVSKWWETNIESSFNTAWSFVTSFFGNLFNEIKNAASSAWEVVKAWWNQSEFGTALREGWEWAKNFLINDVWTPIKSVITDAWDAVKKWWESTWIGEKVEAGWTAVKTFFTNMWEPLKTLVTAVWDAVKHFWEDNIFTKISDAWGGVKDFLKDIFSPLQWAYDLYCQIMGIDQNQSSFANSVGYLIKGAVYSDKNLYGFDRNLGFATGGFPEQGNLFIANEAGAELVGSINGRTAVVNQGQIIEGIAKGVSDANNEQNTLLRQQNELLRGILEKDSTVRFGASVAFGQTAKRSIDMYNSMTGG